MWLEGASNEHIELRVICPVKDDLSSYLSWMQAPMVNRYILSARENFQQSELVDYLDRLRSSSNAIQFGIFSHQKDGRHIGNIKFHDIDNSTREAYVGFLIGDESARGKGIAKQAFELGAQILRRELGTQKFLLGVERDHLSAIRAYEKMGFKRIGNLGEGGLLMAFG